jgi:arylformamidase
MVFDWRRADDATLEQHFNPRVALGAAAEPLIRSFSELARQARQDILGWYDFRYGPSPLETYDAHPPVLDSMGSPAPMLVFIHGGYWRLLDKSDHSWFAPAFAAAGALAVNLNYDLCPAVTLDQIVAEARRAIVHLYEQAASFGCDPDRIFVAGHSAGAQMAAMLLCHDWTAEGLPADAIKGAACISGIYEPEVVMRISVNQDVRLDAAMAARNNCLTQPPRNQTPVIVAVGGDEPEGWRQQSERYAEVCRQAGSSVTYLEVAGTNHFTVATELTRRDSALVQAMLGQMRGS